MKRAVLVLALALAACNDSDLSRNSIPPIAGIVGGPDQPAGNGDVAMELATAAAVVEPASQIKINNESRTVTPVTVTVSTELTGALIQADVGDELSVQWTPAGTEETVTDLFTVQPPQITRIGVADGGDAGFIRLGHNARIEGSGFAHTELGSVINVDGVPHDFAFFGELRPGALTFVVATNSGLVAGNSYKISVHVAGGEPGAHYLSNEYSVQVLPPL